MFKAVGAITERADDLPQVRLAPPGPPDARPSRGSTSRPARWAKACRSGRRGGWPVNTWTSSHTTSGSVRRLGAGGGVDLGGRGQGGPLSLSNLTRSGTSPARPARRKPSSAGTSTRIGAVSRRSGATHRDRRPRPDVHRPALGEALPTRASRRDHRQTVKGKGFSEIENKDGWHGKPLLPTCRARDQELGGIRKLKVKTQSPSAGRVPKRPPASEPVLPPIRRTRRSPRARRTATRCSTWEPSPRWRDGRRGLQLDACGRVRQSLSSTASSRCGSPSSSSLRWPWA